MLHTEYIAWLKCSLIRGLSFIKKIEGIKKNIIYLESLNILF